MTDQRTRWSDDRLDDRLTAMSQALEKLTEQRDADRNLLAAVDLEVVELKRAEDRRSNTENTTDQRRFDFRLAIATVVLGEVGTIVIGILNLIHH